jgi:DNA-directed RNA polymerase subunit RPC12/RpoP
MTLEDYNELLEKQNYRCALCGKPFEGCGKQKMAPHIDHKHSTNEIRGLIHNNCNVLIGMAEEDIKLLRRAIQYLKEYEDA